MQSEAILLFFCIFLLDVAVRPNPSEAIAVADPRKNETIPARQKFLHLTPMTAGPIITSRLQPLPTTPTQPPAGTAPNIQLSKNVPCWKFYCKNESRPAATTGAHVVPQAVLPFKTTSSSLSAQSATSFTRTSWTSALTLKDTEITTKIILSPSSSIPAVKLLKLVNTDNLHKLTNLVTTPEPIRKKATTSVTTSASRNVNGTLTTSGKVFTNSSLKFLTVDVSLYRKISNNTEVDSLIVPRFSSVANISETTKSTGNNTAKIPGAVILSAVTEIPVLQTNSTTATVTDPILIMPLKSNVSRVENASSNSCGMKVIGYYTSWGASRISRRALTYVTHINYAFAELAANGSVSLSTGSADRLLHLIFLRGHKLTPRISLSVGGWGSSEAIAEIVRNETAYLLFIDGMFGLFKRFSLDGLDVDWEYPTADDKELYVPFLKKIREALSSWKTILKRDHLLLTFAGAAGADSLQSGFDIKNLLDGDTVDWVNVMSYDFYGPWAGPAGEFTGPISPLFYAAPRNYSHKLNTHWAIEQYVCQSGAPEKIMLGVPFYGRYWNNVAEDPVDGDPMWRRVEPGDNVTGGDESYHSISTAFMNDDNFTFFYSDKAKAAYAFSASKKVYLGYESPKCADLKAQYAIQNGLGGVMIWAIDMDDDNSTLLKALTNENMCAGRKFALEKTHFNCRERRWWSSSDVVGNTSMSGMCGKMAPLLNGVYPVCDPSDPNAGCCGAWGYCGQGSAYCDCPTCADYAKFPNKIEEDAVKPTLNNTLWHTMTSSERGKCGLSAEKVQNGTTFAICNPDDLRAPCCSGSGFCGVGWDFCGCDDCVDFRKTPLFRFALPVVKPLDPGEKRWWTWSDGPDKGGRCGPDAPLIGNETEAICDPASTIAPCCSDYGFCGGGAEHCQCPDCRDYSKLLG